MIGAVDKINLFRGAARRFGKVYPCGSKCFEECFSEDLGRVVFWYNDESGSTHIEPEYISTGENDEM